MSGYFDIGGTWIDTSKVGTTDHMNPNQPEPVPVGTFNSASNQENEMNIEDPNMWQEVSRYIANKLTTASDLAKRVEELEGLTQSLQQQLTEVRNELAAERVNHSNTQRELQEVQTKLGHEQNAVHDLVQERDIVLGERNQAQEERNNARKDAEAGWAAHREAEQRWEEERHHRQVCEERASQMAERIAALKNALSGLQSL